MHSLDEFLIRLYSLGIQVSLEGQDLRVRGPRQHLDASLQAELRQQKPAMLAFLQNQQESGPQLSFAQSRLWFLEQYQPGLPLYNIPTSFRLRGELDVQALEYSLSQLVQRHAVLRTRITNLRGQACLEQVAQPEFRLSQVDLSGQVSNGQLPEEAQSLALADARAPFDLGRDVLLRATLLHLAQADHLLLLTTHHIASDAWSQRILASEASTIYRAYLRGESSPLPELRLQYADFAAWQRLRLQGPVLEAQLAYWRAQLAGLEPLDLPGDLPAGSANAHRGGRVALQSSPLEHPDLRQKVEHLAGQEGATHFSICLAAWAALLMRYSGQSDLAVGAPVAGRNQVVFESLVGFFVNTLALRLHPIPHLTFRAFLRHVQQVVLGALDHSELPFEKLVEDIHPERQAGVTPFFQTFLDFNSSPPPILDLPGVSCERAYRSTGTAKFDLLLNLGWDSQANLTGVLTFRSERFSQMAAQRLAEQYLRLLHAAAANPDLELGALPLMDVASRRQVLADWNATARDFGPFQPVHVQVADQAQRSPKAIALSEDGRQVSYHALEQAATRLAQLGLGPGKFAGLYLERGADMVAALLAVLKTGAAYLPLDPGYPPERIRFMLDDSGAQVLITHHAPHALLFQGSLLTLDEPGVWQEPPEAVHNSSLVSVQPDDPAYMIYTSGSTGLPKGVVISHANLDNHMRWMQTEYPLDARDVVLQKTPFSFDASVWEFYAPLLAGGRLALARPGGHLDMPYLAQTLHEQQVTVLQMVPTLLRELLDQPGLALCAAGNGGSLRRVFAGGEALEPALANRFLDTCPGVELVNLYGPTEVTIDALSWRCRRLEPGEPLPIGRPIANTQAYILDERLQPQPPGVPGELYLGGAGVGLGYHRQPELTRERFIPDPFTQLQASAIQGRTPEGSRLYRSGDRARWLVSGEVEFLGRVDAQLKLHGVRIEPGEIEAVLEQHPALRQAVVVVASGSAHSGHGSLVACVVLQDNQEAQADVLIPLLRHHLRQQLPDSLVPSRYLFLAEMPLTPSGKTDRRQLTELAAQAKSLQPTQPALEDWQDETERSLAGIWEILLGSRPPGRQADFFALGGHSLLAIRLAALITEIFDIVLPVRAIFDTPQLSELAQAIVKSSTANQRETGEI